MRERLFGLILLFSSMAVFTGCATVFRTNQAQVVAASGATAVPVRVFANGALVYEGNLPATFAVRSGTTYTVAYTAADGEIRTVAIAERFNGIVTLDKQREDKIFIYRIRRMNIDANKDPTLHLSFE